MSMRYLVCLHEGASIMIQESSIWYTDMSVASCLSIPVVRQQQEAVCCAPQLRDLISPRPSEWEPGTFVPSCMASTDSTKSLKSRSACSKQCLLTWLQAQGSCKIWHTQTCSPTQHHAHAALWHRRSMPSAALGRSWSIQGLP